MVGKYTVSAGLMWILWAVTAFASSTQEETQTGGAPWWVMVLIIIILVLLLWWILSRRSREKAATPGREQAEAPSRVDVAAEDFKVIEGIGPKISGVLHAAGIRTLGDLAATDVNRLKQILQQADIALADPSTWPEQASLASAGKWDELKALKDKLKGGRRV